MKSPNVTWISADDPPESFPAIETAFDVPDGLLAAGGDLSEERLLYAYRHGIFPWYDDGQPILWWSPDPRCILWPNEFHVSRRLRRTLSQSAFEVSFNRAFSKVIAACAAPRSGQHGTWITADMALAYTRLHERGWAHSIEVHYGSELVGGLYGLAIGRVFFGESMFSRVDNASKAAMLVLCRHLERLDFRVLDCQVDSPHLLSLGAILIPRSEFAALLQDACRDPLPSSDWPQQRLPISEFLG